MKIKILVFFIFAIFCLTQVQAQAPTKKVKVLYRKHTQLNFSGDKIEGKIRAPAVFYIFQRKRSLGHEVVNAPENFNHHRSAVAAQLQGGFAP